MAAPPAWADVPSTPDENDCTSSGKYTAPPVNWAGKFTYAVKLTVSGGQLSDVDVSAVPGQGTDDDTDRTLSRSLADFVRQHYVCKGPNRITTEYLVLRLKQPPPELVAMQQGSRTVDVIKDQSLKPYCRRMGKPTAPPDWVLSGQLKVLATVQFRAGRIGWVDVKLRNASASAADNKRLVERVVQTIRHSYRCTGDLVFEQELTLDFD